MAQTTLKSPGDLFFSVNCRELILMLYYDGYLFMMLDVDLQDYVWKIKRSYNAVWIRENFKKL